MKFRRYIILFFSIILFGMIAGVTYLHYYVGLKITMELFQLLALSSFVILNILYLFFKILEFDTAWALIFLCTYSLVSWIFERLAKDMEGRTKALIMLMFLAVTTVVVRHLLKKASPR